MHSSTFNILSWGKTHYRVITNIHAHVHVHVYTYMYICMYIHVHCIYVQYMYCTCIYAQQLVRATERGGATGVIAPGPHILLGPQTFQPLLYR